MLQRFSSQIQGRRGPSAQMTTPTLAASRRRSSLGPRRGRNLRLGASLRRNKAACDRRPMTIRVGERPVTLDDLVRVARQGAMVELTSAACARVAAARMLVERLAATPEP